MDGQHHRLNGHEFEQTPRGSEGQGSLVHYSPQGCKESDPTQGMNDSKQQNGTTKVSEKWKQSVCLSAGEWVSTADT